MIDLFNCVCHCAKGSTILVSTNEQWNVFKGDGILSCLSCEMLYCFVFFVAVFIVFNCHKIRKFIYDNLFILAFTFFLWGFLLYYIGYLSPLVNLKCDYGGAILTGMQAGGRAFLSSFSMFIFDSDLIEVAEKWHHNSFYMAMFSFVHFCGVLISTIVIMRILGNRGASWCKVLLLRICSFFRMQWNKTKDTFFAKEKGEGSCTAKMIEKKMYVFWGVNEASITLANSIKEKECDEKIKLLFIETPSEHDVEIKEFSLTHFFSSSLHGNGNVERIEDMHGIILYPKCRLIEVGKRHKDYKKTYSTLKGDVKNKESIKENDIFDELGLKHFRKVSERYKYISYFFLSNDELKNVQDMLLIREYYQLKQNNNKPQISLHCRARRNNQHLIYEEVDKIKNTTDIRQQISHSINIRIVDDANLAVLSLKSNEKYHPISLIKSKINQKAQVTSAFNALILGFGQTGRDAFRFIYEFGSFAGSNLKRSPFHAIIYDTKMKDLIGDFMLQTPALNKPYEDNTKIIFEDTDVKSIKFWNEYEKIVKNLNYVIVALGDDETNLNIAVNLYKTAIKHTRHKEDTDFCIFVRIYNKEYEEQATLITKYLKSKNLGKSKSQCNIVLFGTMSDIYTYENIVSDETRRKAELFNKVYEEYYVFYKKFEEAKEKKAETLCVQKELKTLYEKIDEHYNDFKKQKEIIFDNGKDTINNLFDLWECNRKYQQNLSNAWHINTKEILFQTAIQKCKIDNINKMPIRDPQTNKYEIGTPYQDIFDTIAHCEHLRWNALSELQGYVPYWDVSAATPDAKDIFEKRLGCLRPWEKTWSGYPAWRPLKQDLPYKMQFDYNTIDVSFTILRKEAKKIENNTKDEKIMT